jgi:hypothetical protein
MGNTIKCIQPNNSPDIIYECIKLIPIELRHIIFMYSLECSSFEILFDDINSPTTNIIVKKNILIGLADTWFNSRATNISSNCICPYVLYYGFNRVKGELGSSCVLCRKYIVSTHFILSNTIKEGYYSYCKKYKYNKYLLKYANLSNTNAYDINAYDRMLKNKYIDINIYKDEDIFKDEEIYKDKDICKDIKNTIVQHNNKQIKDNNNKYHKNINYVYVNSSANTDNTNKTMQNDINHHIYMSQLFDELYKIIKTEKITDNYLIHINKIKLVKTKLNK